MKDKGYSELKAKWHKDQPKYSKFDTPLADKSSRPSHKEVFANLLCKIMTGTIWTNKTKERQDMRDCDKCTLCMENNIEIIDSHEHVLGDCPKTLHDRDKLWNKIQKCWTENKAGNITFRPWFSTKTHHRQKYNLEKDLCNKGLIPPSIFKLLKKRNKSMNTTFIKKGTIWIIRKHINRSYLERAKEIREIEGHNITPGKDAHVAITLADRRQQDIRDMFK